MSIVAPRDVGQINLTPVTPALDGTHLHQLIRHYLDSCRLRLDHQVTVDGYEYQLLWFTDWWRQVGPSRAWLLRPDDLLIFERDIRNAVSPHTKRPLSYHTRHTILKRLAEMFRWALDKGFTDRDYTKWIPRADGGPPKRRAAGITSLHHLLEVADSPRNRAIIAMLMGMGLRRAELSGLNVEGIKLEEDGSGHAAVVGKRTKANPTGQRDAAFDAATGVVIIAYLESIGRKSGPLLIGERGNRLTGQGVYKVVKRAIADASLGQQLIGPHDLRRAFATHYRRNRKLSGDLLRRQLGHASYSQTDEYTLLDVDDIRVDLVSPLSLTA